ncbi:hypothetical protein BV96_03962 [Sphingomonas paucimobilis]|nr:hypothetical protein BV96_03962 [Sphingomonas paucimobilis]
MLSPDAWRPQSAGSSLGRERNLLPYFSFYGCCNLNRSMLPCFPHARLRRAPYLHRNVSRTLGLRNAGTYSIFSKWIIASSIAESRATCSVSLSSECQLIGQPGNASFTLARHAPFVNGSANGKLGFAPEHKLEGGTGQPFPIFHGHASGQSSTCFLGTRMTQLVGESDSTEVIIPLGSNIAAWLLRSPFISRTFRCTRPSVLIRIRPIFIYRSGQN